MKKILKEWKSYLNEELTQEDFEKKFVDDFSYSIQDRAFMQMVSESNYSLEGLPNRIIGQLYAGISHTWFTHFGLEGAKFVIEEKINRYLEGLPEDHLQYLKDHFDEIFDDLAAQKMRRADVKYKRKVAYLGRHQLMDWWIADDGIDLFRGLLTAAIDH